jgi:transposase-like protein
MKLYDAGFMALMRSMIEDENACLRAEFRALNPKRRSRRYTPKQKEWATNKTLEIGVRATARLLEVERKTVQRWLRKQGIRTSRAPSWVYEWAERRNKRREKWARIRGY